MKTLLLSLFFAAVPMLVFDAIWLTSMSKRFYMVQLGSLAASKIQWSAGALFYLLYVIGVALLVILPALSQKTPLLQVFFTGALLGLVAYGTYDLTNQATLKNWPMILTLVDMTWGTLLTGTVATIAVYCVRFFK